MEASRSESCGGLSIAVRLIRMADGKCFWFKAIPPKNLRIKYNDRSCFIHSHDDDIVNFYKQEADPGDFIDCKYPLLFCPFACIGSTLYFAGGDKDFDGDVRALNSQVIGPPMLERPSNYAPVLSLDCKNNTSHRMGSFDFSDPLRTEHTLPPQLLTPRYCPKIVAVGGQIFLFGGHAASSSYAPFAEVFNPATGLCSPIQDPPFPNRIGDSRLFVAPFLGKYGEKHILLMSHACFFSLNPPTGHDSISLYNVATDSWESFSDPGRVLFHNSLHIVGHPVPVPEQDSIYWLKASKRSGYICSYNWKTKEFWEGPFIGLHHEPPFHDFGEYPMLLLHIREDLFCVVWHNLLHTPSRSSITSDNICTHIHFTLLRVSKEDPPSDRLFSFVVGCFSHVFRESAACTLFDGFCLQPH
ncbi:uncharacterized protein LOC141706211 [Apium graveolens]|uniref:uncharacterized protein LOC141706211 n=1 Tax=Apium graveolens TaxID=4045 RepID=UPI003D7B99D9